MPVIDLGKVVGDPGASMRFRGEWNSASEYFNNSSYVDTVTHHGSLWVCKQTNTGQEPIEGDYWGIGAQGNSDLNALDVTYDNESSGLSSNTAQGAIDEIVEIEKVVNGNQADSYSPDETYTAGRLVIHNNALWKAKQDIDVAELWTPEHWESTTLAAELSAVSSRIQLDTIEMSVPKGSFFANSAYRVGNLVIFSAAFNIATTVDENEIFLQFAGVSAKSRFDFAIRDSNTIIGDGALLEGTNGIIANAIPLNPGGYFCAGAFVVN